MKMKKMKKLVGLSLAGTLALSLCACGNGSADSGTDTSAGSGTSASGGASVSCGGSTSMETVMEYLKEQFTNDNSGVTVSYSGVGSGGGIEGVSNGTYDIGLSSRDLEEEEEESGLEATVLALDGIVVIVNASCGVSDLSLDQISAIYNGEITNWSEVGGGDMDISLIGREESSGTRDGFESITDTDGSNLDQELTSTGAVISAVSSSAHAIGYASLSAVEGQTGIKALMVDGVECSEETILDGSYTIQRPFVLVTKTDEALSEAAQSFFDFCISDEAADLIRAAGAVPINEDIP